MNTVTPEQREAALKLAKRFSDSPEWSGELSRTLLDLHAENVRLREAVKDAPHANSCWSHRGTVGVAPPCDCWKSRAALSGSPATED